MGCSGSRGGNSLHPDSAINSNSRGPTGRNRVIVSTPASLRRFEGALEEHGRLASAQSIELRRAIGPFAHSRNRSHQVGRKNARAERALLERTAEENLVGPLELAQREFPG